MSINKPSLILGARMVGFTAALLAGGLSIDDILRWVLVFVSWNLMTTVPDYIRGAA